MPPTSLTSAPPSKARIWPITAMLVTVAVLLMLVDGFNAAMQVAPFFGQSAARDDYIGSGMTCLSALPVFVAMIWFGWQRGSRGGLLLIGGPAALMAYLGLYQLATSPGRSTGTDLPRTPDLTDLLSGTTSLNWLAFLVFSLGALATHQRRWQLRHTVKGSGA
jgi:hypothetical protein